MKRSLSLLMLVLFLVSCGSDKSSPLAPTAVALTAVAPPPPPPPPPPLWMASGTGATILDMPTRTNAHTHRGCFHRARRKLRRLVRRHWYDRQESLGKRNPRYKVRIYNVLWGSFCAPALRRSVWRVRDSILAKAPMDVHRRAVRERVISDREHR